jgi:hypothetical protein
MEELAPCPRCQHDNPSENRFCGWCGITLADGGQLVPRVDDSPALAVRDLPAKLGPSGKALAMGVAALATEVGLLWLRRRIEHTDQPMLPATQDSKPTVTESTLTENLISESLEEVSTWLGQGDYQRHTFRRQVTRSFSWEQYRP